MDEPFWIVISGGKTDFTAKWWSPQRMQVVVNHFKALRRRLRVLRGASLVITNRLHVAMPCLGLGVPVIMVEADSLAFRLTALPPWLKIHREQDLNRIDLDPAHHYTQEYLENRATWRQTVRESLDARLRLS